MYVISHHKILVWMDFVMAQSRALMRNLDTLDVTNADEAAKTLCSDLVPRR